jgi:protein-S-isoprenylcysteine O-methyltransferase Ste14
MNENIFRIIAAILFFTGVSISTYYRRKADRETSEKISRTVDGITMMSIIKISGLVLWLSPLAYLLNPQWMVWSKMGQPEWVRWFGIGLGLLCVLSIYWLFSSIGSGITPTSATRREHKLVKDGPYRWVRHPLYTVGSTFFVSFGLVADNWFIVLLGAFAFIAMAIRTPKEEANLIEKFGDEYRNYMKDTGRFLPKLPSR